VPVSSGDSRLDWKECRHRLPLVQRCEEQDQRLTLADAAFVKLAEHPLSGDFRTCGFLNSDALPLEMSIDIGQLPDGILHHGFGRLRHTEARGIELKLQGPAL
jgi:hypothetical protein